MSQDNSISDIEKKTIDSFMKAMDKFQDKTPMIVLLELLKNDKTIDGHLPLISESPNVNYTKALTKLATWRASMNEVFNINPDKYPEDKEFDDIVIYEMIRYFLTFMVGHKRRRAIEIVQGVKGGENQGNVIVEQKRRGILGFGR
jgi:hypothetical protein